MEKYSQFRDRGSGIAPFLPIPTEASGVYLPFHIFLFLVRIPMLMTVTLSYFLVLQWLPIGPIIRKGSLWLILGVPGVWWIDLQIDGVRRGSLGRNQARVPHPKTIIASSNTSPIDALYLAAIFDPVFTASYPSTRLVHRISLLQAMIRAFSKPETHPPSNARLVDLQALLKEYPNQPIVVFPEGTTTNGRGILPLSPSLLTAPRKTKIFPVSLRYTPADITTPVPGTYLTFLWNLCSKPTHCIRVRIAEPVLNTSVAQTTPPASRPSGYATNLLDALDDDTASSVSTIMGDESEVTLTRDEKIVLDKVGDALARLGRGKRLGLGIRDKSEFVKVWTKRRR